MVASVFVTFDAQIPRSRVFVAIKYQVKPEESNEMRHQFLFSN